VLGGGDGVFLLRWVDLLSGAKDLVLEVWWSRMTVLCENRMYAVASPNRRLTATSHLLRRRIEACKALVWLSCSG
jgi:hypothetical protein